MKTITIKTNINCGSCIANVTPVLNDTLGKGNWKVDTQNPNKILTVTAGNIDETEVIKAVEKAGYKGERIF